ncbi:MAG: symmetrical bis(5'-nucleosyl)-tetraphosphatase [Gammaproteobacteria bacterium]|nr:symmetrical bis(5'-nucleosyl)-tetraphosphatase [Gammaproteobacteria bacterium]
MTTYAIGDIQGCYSSFMQLLEKIRFDPAADKLWLVGDLVNRGGMSLQVLRQVYALRDSCVCVLGNHDLHFLALACSKKKRTDNPELEQILQADDGQLLLDWLRCRPLLHVDESLRCLMVHAGIAPDWDLPLAQKLARKVSKTLQNERGSELLAKMYGNRPARWSADLNWLEQRRAIINVFTRMRFCRTDGSLELTAKGPPGSGKNGSVAWFELPRKTADYTVIFGHWSALGLYFGNQVVCLDSGAVWGNKLTAMSLGQNFRTWQVKGKRD